MNWTYARLPASVSKALGKRGQVRIKGTINGFPFRSTLFPDGTGGHVLIINRTMQKGAQAAYGDTPDFNIEEDNKSLPVSTPRELLRALNEEKALMVFFKSLSASMRREISRWVSAPKYKETRIRRADSAAEKLMLVMEGEKEPPPVLQAVFVRNPLARAGWESMPASHKRGHLLGIFNCATPEARAAGGSCGRHDDGVCGKVFEPNSDPKRGSPRPEKDRAIATLSFQAMFGSGPGEAGPNQPVNRLRALTVSPPREVLG